MYIGFFDSGMGGVTVLYDSLRLLKDVDYLYYADTENVPYGTKDKNIVKKHIFKAADFIISQKVDALVIACNTATSIAIRELRARYQIPIIGMEPAVKPAVEKCEKKRVLVFATPLTLREDKYEDLISKVDSDNIVDSLPLPELVKFAENFNFDGEIIENYLKGKLAAFDLEKYGTVVLGCTHFIYFRRLFRKILPEHIDIIDGNIGTINHLSNLMWLKSSEDNQKVDYNKILRRKKGREDINKYHISFFLTAKKGDINFLNKYLNILQ